MQSRFLLGGLAATPEAGGTGTRFAFMGGLRFPGVRLLHPLLGTVGEPLGTRVIRRLEQRVHRR